MSAFGQAGFGSMNRRNQLRAQGQLDPYGQQVRAAKQVPTLNIYQTQGTQQATGQQQAPSQSQPAQQPAAAQPSAPAMPAYSPSYSAGTAQPIAPQTQGTPYSAQPKQDWLQSMSDDELKKSLSDWTAAGTSGTGGAFVDANLKAATAELARRGQSFNATDARRQQLQGDVDRVNRQISEWNDRAQPGQPRIGETFLVNGQPDQQWMQANQYWAGQRRQAQDALNAFNSSNAPASADTVPFLADPNRYSSSQSGPGYAARVAAAEQQWSSTPAGSQQIGNWQNNPSSVARERQQERATREAEMAAQWRASEALGQQANASERLYVQTGFGQRQFQRGDENVTEMAPSYGIAGLGQSHLPRYRQLADGTMQRVDQADRAPIGGWGPPGRAQPIQPQSQGTTYQSQPMVNDRPMRSIEDDMAADREYERQNGWWAQESARRGIDQSTGAPLAGRTNEQAAYADFVSSPQPIGPEPPQFNFDTSRLQAQQDQLMQQSNAAVYKALRRDSSQGNQSPMVSGANDRLRRMLSQNMMLDTWRKKQQAGG